MLLFKVYTPSILPGNTLWLFCLGVIFGGRPCQAYFLQISKLLPFIRSDTGDHGQYLGDLYFGTLALVPWWTLSTGQQPSFMVGHTCTFQQHLPTALPVADQQATRLQIPV